MLNRFRLIEVLVVAGVIALLSAALIPAILAAREAARRAACESNLKQLSLALLNYSDTYRAFPLGTSGSRELPPEERFSWYLPLWNFIEGKPPRLLVDETQAWNAQVNRFPKIEVTIDWAEPTQRTEIRPLGTLRLIGCPSAGRRQEVLGISVTHYVGMAGMGLKSPEFDLDQPGSGVWGYDRQTKINDVAGGLSKTISIIETSLDPGPWLAGGRSTVRGLDIDAADCLGPGRQFGGLHSSCPAAMLDGSVRHLANQTDGATLAAMVTIAGHD